MANIAPVAPGPDEKLTSAVVEHLKVLLQWGQLRPGDKLPSERELGGMLNVSRSSLRQALKSLETMGILVARTGIGNFINPNMDNLLLKPFDFVLRLREIPRIRFFEMREVIETPLAGMTALRASDEEKAAIGRELEMMDKSRDDISALAHHDRLFHLAVIKGCGNEIFPMIYEPLSSLMWEELMERDRLFFDADEILDFHYPILRAIERGESKGAMRAMEAHFVAGRAQFEKMQRRKIRKSKAR